jgi:hypothetical protein
MWGKIWDALQKGASLFSAVRSLQTRWSRKPESEIKTQPFSQPCEGSIFSKSMAATTIFFAAIHLCSNNLRKDESLHQDIPAVISVVFQSGNPFINRLT